MLTLAVIHFFNMAVIYFISKKKQSFDKSYNLTFMKTSLNFTAYLIYLPVVWY